MHRIAPVLLAAAWSTGSAFAQELSCDGVKQVLGSAANGAWPSAAPTFTFDGQPATCTLGGNQLMSCTLAQIQVCANAQPTPAERAAFQARMQKLYATLPATIQSCLTSHAREPYSSNAAIDNYVTQARGLQFRKAGEPSVRLIDSVSRMVSGDYRCETSSSSLEFVIE